MKSTVLLIDDDPLDVKPLQMLIESWGMDTITARSGSDGLAILKDTPVDLVISDVCMPEMKGDEVVKEVTKSYPGLPIILITGQGDVKSAVAAMRLGAFDYVLKPPDETDLQVTVERALEHSNLKKEVEYLRAEMAAGGMYGERLIGRSPAMLQIFDVINRVAITDSTVLLTGETGTGKEMVAQTIHYKSRRNSKPLIAFNCASLNSNLVESELFGHEKGSFTGAVNARRGRFEDADGGTLFLDEIAETSLEFQAKLLRVLQEGELERVGGNKKIKVDTRVIVSTNKDLEDLVKKGEFREDLFYRLKVIPINIPPLREREGDIELLADYFAASYGKRYKGGECTVSKDALSYLNSQDWPGNVRELQHTIERAVVLSEHDKLEPSDFAPIQKEQDEQPNDDLLSTFLDQKTKEHLLSTLDKTGWRKKKAADILGIDRVTLYRLLKKHSINK
ncbi:hypothetical protein BVX97_03465 [bacterium E08(2017)]|nr:hypothetical protein BVX97_03465 [bacterium E08(2017)]